MKKQMRKRVLMATLAVATVLGTVGSAYAVPLVSDVVMTQRTGTRIVDITYTLSGEPAIVTLGIETNNVALPDSAVTRLSGDVCKKVEAGSRSIVWNAGADWPENLTQVAKAKAKVTAWSVDAPPQVMVIDLTGGSSASSYPVNYYVSTAALPYGGLTNSIYKDSQLVMRKIPNGAFTMGELTGTKQVTLTDDFYMGVFQVTQGQWDKVMGTDPSDFKDTFNPVNKVAYDDIRGTAAQGGGGWPTNDSVYTSSFIGRLRVKAGLTTFDLPTDAQWEYACRAETISYYSDGFSTGADTNVLNELGWWSGNSGSAARWVGQKKSNTWGLYDMHGNVWEWCLDWYASSLTGGVNPKGAVSGSARVFRGGCWSFPASGCRSASRFSNSPSARSSRIGFRLVRTLP
ncbi:MAG: formylglycine-generating enzyme family protein [Kiritimatiellae bacterium]|nr:formylglycine-generating enzyme family protein [Kiritimatiellia bacterium]